MPARLQYRASVLVHFVVFLIRLVIVMLWATKLDGEWTFDIALLSRYASITNFVTTAVMVIAQALTTWSLQPLAMHFAFSIPQSLTSLHDWTSAWLGIANAALAVWRNLRRRRLPAHLVVILLYFMSAQGVSISFTPSFTFEGFNQTTTFTTTLNPITTALTRTADNLNLSDTVRTANLLIVQQRSDLNTVPFATAIHSGAAFFGATYRYFPSLFSFHVPGIYPGAIYDTIAGPVPVPARVPVSARAFLASCGEVPKGDWAISASIISGRLDINLSASIDGRTYGVSGILPAEGSMDQERAIYKAFEDIDPSTARASRNFGILALATSPLLMPVDSENTTGYLYAQPLGDLTFYAKAIMCSLDTTTFTAVIDENNMSPEIPPELPSPTPHVWSEAAPLTSRGLPLEDSFNMLFSGVGAVYVDTGSSSAPLEKEQAMGFSLWEQLLIYFVGANATLETMERALANGTTLSYAVLGSRYGYTNISEEVKREGWDPQPRLASGTTTTLRSRFKVSVVPAVFGLIASASFLCTALWILTTPTDFVSDRIFGELTLLPIIAMLRNSNLPQILPPRTLGEDALRVFGANVNVQLDRYGGLHVPSLNDQVDAAERGQNGRAIPHLRQSAVPRRYLRRARSI